MAFHEHLQHLPENTHFHPVRVTEVAQTPEGDFVHGVSRLDERAGDPDGTCLGPVLSAEDIAKVVSLTAPRRGISVGLSSIDWEGKAWQPSGNAWGKNRIPNAPTDPSRN